jgi:hypothetical protein
MKNINVNLNDLIQDEKIYKVKSILNHKNYYQVEENVHVIKNFTTQEERQWYIDIAEAATKEDWDRDKRSWWNKKILYVGDDRVNSQIVVGIRDRIKDLFSSEYSEWWVSGMQTVHRMFPGEQMFIHADNPSGTQDKTNYVQFGMVLYHNDFNGGEIFYKHLGIEYKPEAGDLLMHPGTTKYSHGTKPVLRGPNRYVSTAFAYDPLVKEVRDQSGVFKHLTNGKIDEQNMDPINKYFREKQ